VPVATDFNRIEGNTQYLKDEVDSHKAEDASTTAKGHVQLSSSTSSTSTSLAATASAVKTVKDAALEKNGDGKDVIVTFTEAATEAHIASGEKLSIMFGKILKMFKGKAPNSHASSATTYGVGTTANYGHCKTINGLTQSSHVNGNALSAYQGKVLKDMVDVKLEMVEGSYTGSGVTGRTISLPFTPRIILIFIYDSDNEDAWAIGTKGAIQYGKFCNFFNDSKIVTNGFTVRSENPGNNNSNIVYDYLAIK
jgi:hypothetical protein